eukprot:2488449-Pyramimonas_sp.AAC.1
MEAGKKQAWVESNRSASGRAQNSMNPSGRRHSLAQSGDPYYVAVRDPRKWRAQAEGCEQEF